MSFIKTEWDRPDRTPEEVQREIRGDWWDARLYQLIQKSDPVHLEQIRIAFPQEVREFENWQNS